MAAADSWLGHVELRPRRFWANTNATLQVHSQVIWSCQGPTSTTSSCAGHTKGLSPRAHTSDTQFALCEFTTQQAMQGGADSSATTTVMTNAKG